MTRAPADRPCGSCPYRTDVPSGIWHPDEYVKLPEYDLPTALQPIGVFLCHQQDGRVCAGWAGCHDMDESIALRMAVAMGELSVEAARATARYTTDVPLWPTGAEAARHGLRDVEEPDAKAQRAIERLERRRGAS